MCTMRYCFIVEKMKKKIKETTPEGFFFIDLATSLETPRIILYLQFPRINISRVENLEMYK